MPKRAASEGEDASTTKKRQASSSSSGEIPGGSHTAGGVLLSTLPATNKAFAYPDWVLPERGRLLTTTSEPKAGANCVLYWMSRDQVYSDLL